MVGTLLQQNSYLMQGHQILWKDWGSFFLCFILDADLLPLFISMDWVWSCDSHQGMMNVEGLLTSFVVAGVLRSGVILVGSKVPCHPYHWPISFGVQLVINKISC